MAVMEPLNQGFRFGVTGLVPLVGPPTVLPPVLPVLNDEIHREMATAEAIDRIQKILGTSIALTALPETESPSWQQWGGTGCFAVTGDDSFQIGTEEHGVVDQIPLSGSEDRPISFRADR
jgi:hypothetical protein